ncbi:hypothetical protein AURDEDRAFT_172130 [Auricularia subglabra TFB-10046 SS5]|nr:hypothetical protein AURDEDRAFT_172130 [Auricularia subglabra TFB-10046 SS5]
MRAPVAYALSRPSALARARTHAPTRCHSLLAPGASTTARVRRKPAPSTPGIAGYAGAGHVDFAREHAFAADLAREGAFAAAARGPHRPGIDLALAIQRAIRARRPVRNLLHHDVVDGRRAILPSRLANPVPLFSKCRAALDTQRPWTSSPAHTRSASAYVATRRCSSRRYRRASSRSSACPRLRRTPPPEGAGSAEMRREDTLHRLGRHLHLVTEVAADAIRGCAKVRAQVARL